MAGSGGLQDPPAGPSWWQEQRRVTPGAAPREGCPIAAALRHASASSAALRDARRRARAADGYGALIADVRCGVCGGRLRDVQLRAQHAALRA
eukprot:gene50037-40902_t